MNDSTRRLLTRSTHLLFSVPIIGYVYSPFEDLPNYASVVRYGAIPALALSGLWMWTGPLLVRLTAKAFGLTRPDHTKRTSPTVGNSAAG